MTYYKSHTKDTICKIDGILVLRYDTVMREKNYLEIGANSQLLNLAAHHANIPAMH